MGTKNNPGQYDCYDKAEPDDIGETDEPNEVMLKPYRARLGDAVCPICNTPAHVMMPGRVWVCIRHLDKVIPTPVDEEAIIDEHTPVWQNNGELMPTGVMASNTAGLLEDVYRFLLDTPGGGELARRVVDAMRNELMKEKGK